MLETNAIFIVKITALGTEQQQKQTELRFVIIFF